MLRTEFGRPQPAAQSRRDKLLIARRLRAETILTMKWIAARLHLGTTRNASTRLQELRQRKAPLPSVLMC